MYPIDRFRAALKIPTYWPSGALPGDSAAEAVLQRFQDFLVENYPAFHQAARRRVLSPYSVLYRWPGTGDTSGGADNGPVLILAHYDVVPAESEKWNSDPFGAEMKDGYIYGRGSLDMKNILIDIMEAAEELCIAGFRPKRDIWFGFGGDEERTGVLGAGEAAKWFAGQGQHFAWVLDEGTPIGEDQIRGVSKPLALVSIEEKGYLTLDLSVAQEPGHASRPPATQAAAVLGRALCRIAARPFPYNLTATVESFFKQVSNLAPFPQSFVMRHARSFGPLFFMAAGTNPTAVSMLRTTVAMTQLRGSAAENVMPSEAHAIINLRLLEPWTVESAKSFIKKAVNDKQVQIKIHSPACEPVPAKWSFQSSGWKKIETAVAQVWPGVPILPFIMVAMTDSRHFAELTDGIFRFNPYKLSPKDLDGIHSHDERISEENFMNGLRFYTKLLEIL